jgi:hypothetical protein
MNNKFLVEVHLYIQPFIIIVLVIFSVILNGASVALVKHIKIEIKDK